MIFVRTSTEIIEGGHLMPLETLEPSIKNIDHFSFPSLDTPPAVELEYIRKQAPIFKEWFRQTGQVSLFAARSLVTLPYPRKYALWESCVVPNPYIWMTNRVFIIQWEEDGVTKTMLAEPTDYELGVDTPYIQKTFELMHLSEEKALSAFFKFYKPVVEHLNDLGISPESIDYLSFDHLHTQDIRRIVGTTKPEPDLGFSDRPVPPLFPNAKLIVQRHELDHVKNVHPFQSRFHQSWTYDNINEDNLLFVDGDVLLGPGVALLRTPGHTLGNHTLVVNTSRGIFTSSENGVGTDSYVPHLSKIPGVKAWAKRWNMEVVMNFNTPEYASWQYNSMIKEKLIADTVPEHPEFPQCFPSSELVKHWLSPFIKPMYQFGDLTLQNGNRKEG